MTTSIENKTETLGGKKVILIVSIDYTFKA